MLKKITFLPKFLEVLNNNDNFKTSIEIGLALLLFGLFFFGIATFSSIVVHILSFVVFLEIIKVITGFISGKEHIVQLRIVIDGFIVFFLRDMVLIFSNEKYIFAEQVNKIALVSVILILLFIFRIISLKYSPNDKNCSACIAISDELKEKLGKK